MEFVPSLLLYLAFLIIFTLPLTLAGTFRNQLFGVGRDRRSSAGHLSVKVRHGEVSADSSPTSMDDTAVLDVDDHSVLVLDKFGLFTRVVGPGQHRLARYERIIGGVDLRPHKRQSNTTKIYTRDGIPLEFDVEIEFRLKEETTPDKAPAPGRLQRMLASLLARWGRMSLGGYRFSAEAARKAAYGAAVQESGEVSRWSDTILRLGMGEIEDALSDHSFDEVCLPGEHGDGKSRGERSIRRRIQREAEAAAARVLANGGAQLITLRFSSFRFDQPETRGVLEQHFNNWQSYWGNDTLKTNGEGRAEVLRTEGNARADTYERKLVILSDGLKQAIMRRANADHVLILRALEMLEYNMSLDQKSYRFPPHDVLDLIRELKGMLGSSGAAPNPAPPTLPTSPSPTSTPPKP